MDPRVVKFPAEFSGEESVCNSICYGDTMIPYISVSFMGGIYVKYILETVIIIKEN